MGILNRTSVYREGTGVGVALVAFVLFGLYLFIYSLDVRAFSSNQIVWDLQWLNA